MDHPFNETPVSRPQGGWRGLAKKLDIWALENPHGAALAGAALGLASSIVLNRILFLKGTAAITSCAYGAAKGALTGYTYPTLRGYDFDEFFKRL